MFLKLFGHLMVPANEALNQLRIELRIDKDFSTTTSLAILDVIPVIDSESIDAVMQYHNILREPSVRTRCVAVTI